MKGQGQGQVNPLTLMLVAGSLHQQSVSGLELGSDGHRLTSIACRVTVNIRRPEGQAIDIDNTTCWARSHGSFKSRRHLYVLRPLVCGRG